MGKMFIKSIQMRSVFIFFVVFGRRRRCLSQFMVKESNKRMKNVNMVIIVIK